MDSCSNEALAARWAEKGDRYSGARVQSLPWLRPSGFVYTRFYVASKLIWYPYVGTAVEISMRTWIKREKMEPSRSVAARGHASVELYCPKTAV